MARTGYTLPLSLAMEAAAEAIRACESNGYAVSAAVVDVSGVGGSIIPFIADGMRVSMLKRWIVS